MATIIAGCARMGSPDGGWYDDDPPRIVSCSPADQATNVKTNKIIITFDEYIKLEDPTQSVIVSPPQLEMPEIKDAVAVTDMATPLTYERYCSTFEGSYMTDWPPFRRLYHAPVRYREGLYFTGQRTAYSGGLPPAAQSGRTTAQTVCKDLGVEFVGA